MTGIIAEYDEILVKDDSHFFRLKPKINTNLSWYK
jgi:hypothetical protein